MSLRQVSLWYCSVRASRWISGVLTALWVVLLVWAVSKPALQSSPPNHSEEQVPGICQALAPPLGRTQATIWLALGYYGLSLALQLTLPTRGLRFSQARWHLTRWCWTLAWFAYLIHVALAFHDYHHWSHQEAINHVEQASGFGPGIYFSHLFTLVWTLDVLAQWVIPGWYLQRPGWIDWLLHGYLAFIVFQATVVFEQGVVRWASVVGMLVLGILLMVRWYSLHPMRSQS